MTTHPETARHRRPSRGHPNGSARLAPLPTSPPPAGSAACPAPPPTTCIRMPLPAMSCGGVQAILDHPIGDPDAG